MRNETRNEEIRRRALEVAARVQAEMEERFRAGGVVWTREQGGVPRLSPERQRAA